MPLFEDKLGPKENQSPVWKNRPTNGANLAPEADYVKDSLIGGNKHTASGGGTDDYSGENESTRTARKNQGIDTPEGPYTEEFSEGDSYGDQSIGATMDEGSID